MGNENKFMSAEQVNEIESRERSHADVHPNDVIALCASHEALRAELDWLYANCKIIHWPADGSYQIEHTMAANKDSRMYLEMARNVLKGKP